MNVCKGTCNRYKATKSKGKQRYVYGQKRCPVCAIFIICDDVRCPCCKVKLRTTPRANKSRKEIQIQRNCVWY